MSTCCFGTRLSLASTQWPIPPFDEAFWNRNISFTRVCFQTLSTLFSFSCSSFCVVYSCSLFFAICAADSRFGYGKKIKVFFQKWKNFTLLTSKMGEYTHGSYIQMVHRSDDWMRGICSESDSLQNGIVGASKFGFHRLYSKSCRWASFWGTDKQYVWLICLLIVTRKFTN